MPNDIRAFDSYKLSHFDAILFSLATSKFLEIEQMRANKDDSDPLYTSNLMKLEGQRMSYLHARQIFRQTFGQYYYHP